MANKMLIDAAHPEETRVVVVRGNRVEEFDFESQARKQLRGSIFLAKVIRVEPSLQAAFVDYGGNRHGFLAFAEIHPDYYRLPYADVHEPRPEPLKNGAAGHAEFTEHGQDPALGAEAAPVWDDGLPDEAQPRARSMALDAGMAVKVSDIAAAEPPELQPDAELGNRDIAQMSPPEASLEASPARQALDGEEEPASMRSTGEESEPYASEAAAFEARKTPGPDGDADGDDDAHDSLSVEDGGEPVVIESVGGEDALEELPQRERPRRRLYKIQEVIKRNQILLVQVVKEERGTKGAALTTYLSLAGRYTVLMPNTASGGGISRKINVATDRKRLREIAGELEVPHGMGLIIRTAGAARTKAEIKRDYEYLLRLWENVRDLTLKSKAPTLVYEEGDLIKRSIRDLYNREIDEVLVAGDDAYREAKDFMRMLMPSHAKNVQPYKEPEPIFIRHNVEGQLNLMFNPRVTLRSGGYIVINQTEALVAVDVNSGKSTREHSIEETALKTNMEAAEEISRQLRLRDLAGLIVIDFIDMEERRNNRTVEKKLKDCLRNDRARIQVGRISPFGLLEMSRQRLRTGMVEGSTKPCPHCEGTGVVRSTESVALMVLRAIEETLLLKGPANLAASTSVDAALYILNNKRGYLRDIEMRYAVTVNIAAVEHIHGSGYAIEKVSAASPRVVEGPKSVQMNWAHHADNHPDEADEAVEADDEAATSGETERQPDERARRRKRRRGRGGQGDERFARDGEAQDATAQARGADRFNRSEPMRRDDDGARRANGAGAEAAASEAAMGEAPGGGVEGDGRPQGTGDTDEQRRSRRSRRRGRRGGHRHRPGAELREGETPGQAGLSEPARHAPGLGEQPYIAFEPEAARPQALAHDGAAAHLAAPSISDAAPGAAVEPAPQAEAAAPEIEAVPQPAEAKPERRARGNGAKQSSAGKSSAAAAAMLEEAGEPVAAMAGGENSAPAETPSAALSPAPEPQPQSAPRKTGPLRGGWWQRRADG